MRKEEILYKKIKDIQQEKGLTVAKIAEKTGVSKQTVSHRILNIKKNGIVNLRFIQQIEELAGVDIIKFF
ncbi:winged helix-turn-helix transcriptional regulator [Cetobacterium sp. ZOR0034]|uniref:winged helix-turn-helix transcriptional regulator n=1 Tax=Cetobacterium sp. ZOR0034 TaxID=1339239 RepID=UPI0006484A2E|nr:winged helix-turn-helix transcriptional regulator [Cetobacterium sp. ZOR0034]